MNRSLKRKLEAFRRVQMAPSRIAYTQSAFTRSVLRGLAQAQAGELVAGPAIPDPEIPLLDSRNKL